MNANEFVTKLKANNTAEDISDLVKVFEEYNVILEQLQQKDRAPFSLNVLCILCRNLEKAPQWRETIDNKALLTLSIDCIRETRGMERSDRVKTLACIYHIHRHVVRQDSLIPPELVLKVSFMPFELEAKHLLSEYSKTYWNILVDRLSYIERLRYKIPIIKLLPKVIEDALKIIEIYDTLQFCNSALVFLVKKLHLLYSDKHPKELNQIFTEIFIKLSTKDMKAFKKLQEKELIGIYMKLNECLYVIAENASKTSFKDSPLDKVVRTCITIVGHSPDLFHCLQTFYSNTFCCILTKNTDLKNCETVLDGLLVSFERTVKLGYKTAMIATYPFLNQFLRLYIEHHVTNCDQKPWKDNFNIEIQKICLKLIQVLMQRLKNCNQMLKCDNCQVKSGLHDGLRLSFLVKHFITVSLSQNILLTDILPVIYDIIKNQYNILAELRDLGCVNYEKCFRKLQTDVHNTAISLNKAQYYEFSTKFFDVYLTYEINQPQLSDSKNISRALYNKSICELDSKVYENALIDAFLSLVYSKEALSSEKYMSLVMDIKAKELKSKEDDEADDEADDDSRKESLQLFSVLNACERALGKKMYGNIKPFLMDLKFSELLRHEFLMYAKLWPSVTPIGGVWKSLLDLTKGKYEFTGESAEALWTLYEVIVETPSVVREVTNGHFQRVIVALLDDLDRRTLSPDLRVVYASLLLLHMEYNLFRANTVHQWILIEPMQIADPDKLPSNRLIPQEYAATKSGIRAVSVLAEMSPHFDKVSNTKCLQNCLNIYQVYVQLLLHLSRDIEGLQLAYMCCLIADCVGDNEAYVRNAGTLAYHGGSSAALQSIITLAADKCRGQAETAIVFLCDASMYYSRRGAVGLAARLAQAAQARVLATYGEDTRVRLELSVGRLMEAQMQLCQDSGPSILSALIGTQRQYLSASNTGTTWHKRRLHSLTTRVHCARVSLGACRAARALRVWRRARACAGVALMGCAAPYRAAIYAEITDANSFDDAQVKIDNRLKHVLGLQSAPGTKPSHDIETKKLEQFTPKQEIEIMLENMVFKKATSPSLSCTSVPAFKAPDFLNHVELCDCANCAMPLCYIISCQTSGLEASMYFRANETDIARNYFNGVLKMLQSVEEKLKCIKKRNKEYDEFIVESVVKNYWDFYRRVKCEILIELSFFALKNKDFDLADKYIVEIHENLQEQGTVDSYTTNEIMNLMTCSAQLRKLVKKREDTGLEVEFESLKLSPMKFVEPPRTPISKPIKPLKPATKKVARDEEVPKRGKCIKLNLDEDSEEKEVKKVTRKPQFKVPAPTSKHNLEAATPLVGTKPKILLTQPSDDKETPKTKSMGTTDTPDVFYTPMTSMIPATKPTLRHNIVKNLEKEFKASAIDAKSKENVNENQPMNPELSGRQRTKRADKNTLKRATSPVKLSKEPKEPIKTIDAKSKENVNENQPMNLEISARQRTKRADKNTLKRATSPGKLINEPTKTRTSRLRKAVNFSGDEDK